MQISNAAEFFDAIGARLDSDPKARAALQEIGATYQFVLNGDGGGSWSLNLAQATVRAGADAADCTVEMAARDFVGMVNGEEGYAGQQLFMLGKLMISGDMTLALQLESVFRQAAG